MKAVLNSLRRFALTGLMVVVAPWAGYKLWDYYLEAPWTRDGHVRADVVPVAPDVSGFVTEVLVRDNQQVQRGDVLFRIDRARYAIALQQAEAALHGKRATLDEANADLKRYSALTPDVVVSKQRLDQVVAAQGTAKAAMTRPSRTATREAQPRAQRGARLRQRRRHQHGAATGDLPHPRKGVMALLDSTRCTSRAISRKPSCSASMSAMPSRCGCWAATTCCKERWKALRPVSRIAIAAPAQPCSPTSIRLSTGCGGPTRSGPDRARSRRAE